MFTQQTCVRVLPRNAGPIWTGIGLWTWVAAVVLSLGFTATLSAQGDQRNGESQVKDRSVEVPESSVELPGDVGIRAHTNHLIVLRPERLQQAARGIPVGETPGSLACLYELPGASVTSGCPISGILANGNNGLLNPSGGSKTIAIVDAYDYPTAYNDLTVFSKQFGLPVLPQCSTTAIPPITATCFQQVYAAGSKPASNGSWALEEALDIEWAHAMAPGARIVLVEASSNSLSALFQAVTAATQQVTQSGGFGEVSMSWGSSEFSGESSYDSYFPQTNNNDVVYFAAAGDSGGQTLYPSVSPDVVSAGGTTVNRNSSGDFVSETTWSSGGGGPSSYELIPSYQAPVANLAGKKRGTPDFSFDASPNSGVFVYDSTAYDGSKGWWLVGGTSVASPSLAGIVNLANSFNSSSTVELEHLYSSICAGVTSTSCTSSTFYDITSGSAGRYRAATGWDFTTGLGSVRGLGRE